MRAGARARLRGPAGQFVLDDNPGSSAVFLAGGIGITPFVSILRHEATTKRERKLRLFYSNRRPEDAAFLAELQRHHHQNPNFRFVGTMTDMGHSRRPWSGELGFINKEMLARHIDDLLVPTYYIAGPPAMVEAMGNILAGAGVNAAQVRTDEFFGY
jgi:ferredoxin-NADP reductase